MAIAPEVAVEYGALTDAGAAPGSATLRQAEGNVARKAAASNVTQKAAASAPAAAPAGQRSSGQRSSSQQGTNLDPLGLKPKAQRAYGQVSTPSRAAQTITRIVWAVALGLIVLEIASEATGQYWDFKLPASGSLKKEPYRPLYGPGAAGTSAAAALPGVLGGAPAAPLPLITGGTALPLP